MTVRQEFEDWLKTKCEPWDFVKFPHANTEWFVREQVYSAWLAGRESMRAELLLVVQYSQYRNGFHTHEGTTMGHFDMTMIDKIKELP